MYERFTYRTSGTRTLPTQRGEPRDHAFTRIEALSKLGSAFMPFSNLVTTIPGAWVVMERTGGIACERSLSMFHRRRFAEWFEQRGDSRVPTAGNDRRVLLFQRTQIDDRPGIKGEPPHPVEKLAAALSQPD
ncbi:hypothetical protein [Halococcus sp. PRR34]|uniref:hypothetical protein n=1 Tax=Halococcus sp. PRR34 TaxID=3020830 RepID=UPI002362301D|nr:hypothetical protein [Halococcus sp. PRR34]